MTRDEMGKLKVGDKIRKPLPGHPLCHIIAIISDEMQDVAMVKWWHPRHKFWRYYAVDASEMEILYEIAR